MYRVEADFPPHKEHIYTFSIDGVSYENMVTRSELDRRARENNDAPSKTERRASVTPNKTTTPRTSPKPNSTQKTADISFDPFGDNTGSAVNTDSFDPFSSNNNSNNNNNNKSFDSFDSTAPLGTTKQSDPFASTPSPTTSKSIAAQKKSSNTTANFDPFDDNSGGPSSDPFGSSPSSASSANNTKPTAKPVATSLNKPQQSGGKDSDLLAVGEATPPPKPQRRASAIEIQQDFADMTFTAAPAPKPVVAAAQHSSGPAEPNSPSEDQKKAAEEELCKDPWKAKNLVDLDLSGKESKEKARRQSVATGKGPTLGDLMGNPNTRRTSIGAGDAPVMGGASQPQQQPQHPASEPNDDPFGAPALLVATNVNSAQQFQQQQQQGFASNSISAFNSTFDPYANMPPPQPVGAAMGAQQQRRASGVGMMGTSMMGGGAPMQQQQYQQPQYMQQQPMSMGGNGMGNGMSVAPQQQRRASGVGMMQGMGMQSQPANGGKSSLDNLGSW